MRLRCALGSHSKCFVDASLQRLMAACCLPRQAIPTSVSVSAALAIIESLEPRTFFLKSGRPPSLQSLITDCQRIEPTAALGALAVDAYGVIAALECLACGT